MSFFFKKKRSYIPVLFLKRSFFLDTGRYLKNSVLEFSFFYFFYFFQVRIAVFGTRNVTIPPGFDYVDQQIAAFHTRDDDLELTEQTDIHYGSTDGTAVFNWRLLFDAYMPCSAPTFRLQLKHSGLLGTQVLGEVNLNLARDFANCRKAHGPVELPRAWVPVTQADHPGKTRGEIDMQVR